MGIKKCLCFASYLCLEWQSAFVLSLTSAGNDKVSFVLSLTCTMNDKVSLICLLPVIGMTKCLCIVSYRYLCWELQSVFVLSLTSAWNEKSDLVLSLTAAGNEKVTLFCLLPLLGMKKWLCFVSYLCLEWQSAFVLSLTSAGNAQVHDHCCSPGQWSLRPDVEIFHRLHKRQHNFSVKT